MNRNLAILVVIALAVAACGGGDEGAESTTTVASQSDATQPGAGDSGSASAPSTTEAKEPAVAAGQEGTGTATIGDTTWTFELDDRGTCDLDVNDAGAFLVVVLYGTDESGREVALNISGPASGGEMMVQAGSAVLEFERWTADNGVYDRLSGIEGMPDGVGATGQVDGNTVSGSGVFYDDKNLNDVRPTGGPYEAGVLEGTFSATCPG